MRDWKALIKAVGRKTALSNLSIERTPAGKYQVRVSRPGKPCAYFVGRCSIEGYKPEGGRDFECWNPSTYARTYFWDASMVERLVRKNSKRARLA